MVNNGRGRMPVLVHLFVKRTVHCNLALSTCAKQPESTVLRRSIAHVNTTMQFWNFCMHKIFILEIFSYSTAPYKIKVDKVLLNESFGDEKRQITVFHIVFELCMTKKEENQKFSLLVIFLTLRMVSGTFRAD